MTNQQSTLAAPTGRRLTLVVPSLAFGGAERVVAKTANHWAAHGDVVTVVTLSGEAGDTYPLDPRVLRMALNAMHESRGPLEAIRSNLDRLRLLRSAIVSSAPETVISFTDRMNVLTLLACRPLGVDTVISERIDPSRHKIGRTWSWLRRRVYPSARALVVQTERVHRQMGGVMRGRPIYVIPNAVEAPPRAEPRPAADDPAGLRWIIAVGRLAPQKGFDLLIDAFSRIAERHPRWSLKILGEGPARSTLEQLIDGKGLAGRVVLAGWESDPTAVLRGSDLFVLSSRFEGFPNALLEAMACGLPAISFDCESGPAEIVREEIDGLLVPPEDVGALAKAIDRALTDEALRARLGAEAVHVVERFSVESYFAHWETVLRRDTP
ncbi:MAG TPA: glycosyltransferase family 4 protein [Planctomycetaceae bacterium]|jgi:glycosyltransferase involved in cell wall biosynthesis|nr:glycosyltransferase family 4 protein [Planctomycetaceae bacterium]